MTEPITIRDMTGRVLLVVEKKGRLELDDADLRGANLEKANLEGATCMGTNFEGANLKAADLYWLNAFQANFANANLEEARLNGADLKAANFDGANVANADFSKDNVGGSTDLRGTHLENARITGATKFEGAIYSSGTRFPKGFRPDQQGMILRDNVEEK